MSFSKNPLFRFLLVGGTNTVITAALVVTLSYVITGWLAFTVAFTLGLIFSLLVTGKWCLIHTRPNSELWHSGVLLGGLCHRDWFCFTHERSWLTTLGKWCDRAHNGAFELYRREAHLWPNNRQSVCIELTVTYRFEKVDS